MMSQLGCVTWLNVDKVDLYQQSPIVYYKVCLCVSNSD
jgi:hypothetical protein